MSRKYYAHFVANVPRVAGPGEYSGVFELRQALHPQRELAELRTLLARSFDLPPGEIRILNWAALH